MVATVVPDEFTEIGSSGLEHWSGTLYEEPLPVLRGSEGIRTYAEMARYPTIGAVLLAIDNLVRRVDWHFEPREGTGPEGERWADHCESCIHDMSTSWADTVSSIFSLIPFGWAFCEVVVKRREGEQPDDPGAPPSSDYDDGLIGWRKVETRAQESLVRWEIGPNGSVRGMWQQVLGQPAVLIPIERAGLFRTTTRKGSPEGVSVLRSAFEPWRSVRRIRDLEGIGIERDLAGLPICGVPAEWLTASATAEQRQVVEGLKRMLRNVRRNSMEGALIPRDLDDKGNDRFEFKLLTSGGARQFDINGVIGRYNREMAMCVLADWLFLGHDGVGARSLASTRVDVFTTALETWTQMVADVFDSHITPRLLRINGVSGRLTPRLRPGKVRQVDLREFSEAMAELISSGAVVNDDDTEGYIREQVGLPPKMKPELIEEEEAEPAPLADEPEAEEPPADRPEAA